MSVPLVLPLEVAYGILLMVFSTGGIHFAPSPSNVAFITRRRMVLSVVVDAWHGIPIIISGLGPIAMWVQFNALMVRTTVVSDGLTFNMLI